MNKPAQPLVPGRSCPLSYRYEAAAISGAAALEVDTLWVAGGLYGNPFALERLLELYDAERGSKALVFNGDFHWFDISGDDFSRIEASVARFLATRGNVETELAAGNGAAGCGCAYPDWVHDETVALSNRIMERLSATARDFPQSLARLAALPMHLAADVGGERVAIVHGDTGSLAGWAFSQEVLGTRAGLQAASHSLEGAGARIVACSHTCLPVLQAFPHGRAIVNNGAAGMPNFHGDTRGIATRISVAARPGAVYSLRAGPLHVEALAIAYDARAWQARFLEQWPPASDAHRSYFARILHGPNYSKGQALRSTAALAA
jgi:hypothetical protein